MRHRCVAIARVVLTLQIMMRHGSIHCNDDELEQEMQPLLNKLVAWQNSSAAQRTDPSLAWLRTWTSPIEQSKVEALTPGGADDARRLGRELGELYTHLLPGASDDLSRFDVWASKSERDIDTAKAFITGALPDHNGGDGSGDDHVNLIVVPKSTPDWKKSLTPHVRWLARAELTSAESLQALRQRARQARAAHVGADLHGADHRAAGSAAARPPAQRVERRRHADDVRVRDAHPRAFGALRDLHAGRVARV